MTRADYLNQLEQALFQLHPSARQEALDYFNEYFDEKDNDEEAIIELGTPDEAAKEIIANLPEDALITEKDQASPHSSKPFDFNFDFDFQFDWENFFNNFKHSVYQARERIELTAKIEELPEFSNLQISLEDQALSVQSYDGETVLLHNPISEDGSYQAFDYQLVQDSLYISSKPTPNHLYFSNNQTSSAILKIPKKLLPLTSLNLKTTDSSLTMAAVQASEQLVINAKDSSISMTKVSCPSSALRLEDSTLTISDGQMSELKLEASDAVITLTSLNLANATIRLEDCVWKLNEFALENSLNCKAEDTILTFKPSADISLDIWEEDSSLKLPKDKAFTMMKEDDITHLSYRQENSPAQLVIHCQDCQLNVG
ncbi:DUF4097 family beta strand repeat-containing protein [Streptococcus suis]|uniref:DUF4097 family beta strand repeat-containing protein n=1 Tax=Streptococcus suis TaxID=1307 RepID=UPI0015521E25|nr:DUF4097 family beta strand repeat-containing protein [Streptococcus suis]MCO8178288.1 DUF4097 family beta strand repeat-containing protein [Streptococcus suis]NQI88225.1 DUF4097 family beta strand repeat protein [Streptococcus suis]NQI92408.1 DUF4097 family beta strand repeat protein [Streptococcus suis]NQJ00768.1 DUF4097 family beta strand repeat protein [Streptococcus suis]HEM3465002.1 DUF4097 family beta strand repeat protein [Streptococcus suis]